MPRAANEAILFAALMLRAAASCSRQAAAATKGKQSNIERRRRQTAPANKIYTTVIIHYPCQMLWPGLQPAMQIALDWDTVWELRLLPLMPLLLHLRLVMCSSLAAFGVFINFSLAVQTVLCPAYTHTQTHTCINVCGHFTQ